MPLISQLTAIRRYRELTGTSIVTATRVVRRLATYPDNKRWKVSDRELQRDIDKANAPVEIDIRPLSDRQRARMIG